MQVLKKSVKEKIYQAAVEEFYRKGFLGTKMQDIAKKAGISVGLIYRYFDDKEDLFTAIVEPVYKEIIKSMENEKKRDSKTINADNLFGRESELILQILRKKRKIFLILVDQSKGTVFERSREQIVEVTMEHIKRRLSSRINDQLFRTDEVFYHILANNFIEGLLEIARHYRGSQWARNMVKLLTHQYFYGVSGFCR